MMEPESENLIGDTSRAFGESSFSDASENRQKPIFVKRLFRRMTRLVLSFCRLMKKSPTKQSTPNSRFYLPINCCEEGSNNNESCVNEFSIDEFSILSSYENDIDTDCDFTSCISRKILSSVNECKCRSFLYETFDIPNYLDEKIINNVIEIEKNEENPNFLELAFVLEEIISNPNKLSKSFRLDHENDLATDKDSFWSKSENDCFLPLKKPTNLSETQVDFKSLRSSMKKVFDLDNKMVNIVIELAIAKLCKKSKLSEWNISESESESEIYLHCFVICFEILPYLAGNRYSVLPELSSAAAKFSIQYQARLAHIWAEHCKDKLEKLVHCFQERITEILLSDDLECLHLKLEVINLTKVLKIAFYANILAGEFITAKSRNLEDDLEKELQISANDCHTSLIPYEKFYNVELSKKMLQDSTIYLDSFNYFYRILHPEFDENKWFSFHCYSFILSQEAKIKILHREIDMKIVKSKFQLKIRRDKIVENVLEQLLKVIVENPEQLRQRLTVKFVNEDAIDHGGVSREFFQIIIEKLFDKDFGLFKDQEDSKTVWFNSNPMEHKYKYIILGIILGLAVNNQINLGVNFPMVMFRKLLGGIGSFNDLEDSSPTLYRSLKDLLDYEDDDMEDCFMQTFEIVTTNAIGELTKHELKPNGGDIRVGQHNKREFVDLYSDFLLNQSVNEEFQALKKGFEMVTDELPIKKLLRAEEFELLICGSKTLDFVELEEVTDYDGGYSEDSKIIQDFWSIVHSFTDEMKRKLLEFTTGSDRVPVGGLSCLIFKIQRNGSDSDRLPSSHTCFNILLLPEYKNKEKLEERLREALKYTRGFGLL